nr:hypothetical protein CFP56_50226 [Quercus suber]
MQLIFGEMKNFKERSLSKGSYPDDSSCPIRLPKHLLVLVRKEDDVRQEFFSDKIRVNHVTEDFVIAQLFEKKKGRPQVTVQ